MFKIWRTNFPKPLDKIEPMFYNIKQNKRAEHLCRLKREMHRKEMIYMTTSNAKNLEHENRERRITLTTQSSRKRSDRSDKSLRPQKLAGGVVLAVSLAAVVFGGELSAAAVMIPPALAAVFSKEKLLDFGIFGNGRE